MNLCSNWVDSYISRLASVSSPLNNNLIVLLPPVWVDHALLLRQLGLSYRFFLLSLHGVLTGAFSPSRGCASPAWFSILSMTITTLSGLLLLWSLPLLEITLTDNLTSRNDGCWLFPGGLICLQQCFHSSRGLLPVETLMVSTVDIDKAICFFTVSHRLRLWRRWWWLLSLWGQNFRSGTRLSIGSVDWIRLRRPRILMTQNLNFLLHGSFLCRNPLVNKIGLLHNNRFLDLSRNLILNNCALRSLIRSLSTPTSWPLSFDGSQFLHDMNFVLNYKYSNKFKISAQILLTDHIV